MTLHLGRAPEPWMWALIAIALALAIVEVVMAHRRGGLTRGRAWAVSALRVTGLLALTTMATELALRTVQPVTEGRRVAVLVDGSASMALPDGEEDARTTRADRANETWSGSDGATARAAWNAAGLRVDAHAFDGSLHTLGSDDAGAGSITAALDDPRGAHSDLAGALAELAEREASKRSPLASIVVLSDGLVAHSAAEDARLFAVAEALDVPITTVAAGREAIRDVAIGTLAVGEFAFVENVTIFEVELIARGLDGAELITLELYRDGERIAAEPIRLADGARNVQLELIPDRVGQFVYEFRIPELDGEATARNNRRLFVVKVLRDKVRALHVAGRPDWDVRALRTLLRRDPNVELLSYYILRDDADATRSDESAPMSLIGFPVEELFDRQLETFDLVILHNFDARTHDLQFENVARYVLGGGALVVIGGDLGLASGDYVGTALGGILPVDMRRRSDFVSEPLRPRLTGAGRHHPITRFLGQRGEDGWEGLPALTNHNPIALAKDERLHPTALLEGPEGPILATGEPGAGRVLALMTGASWRLGFAPDLPLIDGARPYDLLWLGAVRWLLRDEAADRLVLETNRSEYAPGMPVEIGARTLSPSYLPQPDVDVRWELRRLDRGIDESTEAIASGRWTTDALGRARHEITGLERGAYELLGRRNAPDEDASPDGAAPGDGPRGDGADTRAPTQRARRVFVIDEGHRELAEVDATAGTARLARLARATEGQALVAGDDDLPLSLPVASLDRPGTGLTRTRDVPVGAGWPAMLIVLFAFAGEWWLRRRGGLA